MPNPNYTRVFDVVPGSFVRSQPVEDELLRIEQGFDAVEAKLGNGLRAPAPIGPMPADFARANKLLSFDASGNPVTTRTLTAFDASVTAATNAGISATADAATATTKAGEASTSASNALGFRNTASTHADNASTSATNAGNSAIAAANSATQAATTFRSTSTTSLTLSTATKSFTTQTNKNWTPGQYVVIARTSDPVATQMSGSVTAYDNATGAMSVSVDVIAGSGTFTDWTVSLSGRGGSGGAGGGYTLVVVTATTVTAVAGQKLQLTNAAATTVTLPASPSIGDRVAILIGNGLFTNVVARNGRNIESLAEDLIVNRRYGTVELQYVDATRGWTL